MSLLKIAMKLVNNFYSSFKGSKYKMAAKFGQKFGTKSTDVPFLSEGIFDSKTLHNKLQCQQLNFRLTWSPRGQFQNVGF